MVQVTIGNETRELNDANPQWINEQIGNRRSEGSNVCVRVKIDKGNLDLTLSTLGCGGGGGGRMPKAEESECLDLWNKLKLNTEDFTSGNLIAFLNNL